MIVILRTISLYKMIWRKYFQYFKQHHYYNRPIKRIMYCKKCAIKVRYQITNLSNCDKWGSDFNIAIICIVSRLQNRTQFFDNIWCKCLGNILFWFRLHTYLDLNSKQCSISQIIALLLLLSAPNLFWQLFLTTAFALIYKVCK